MAKGAGTVHLLGADAAAVSHVPARTPSPRSSWGAWTIPRAGVEDVRLVIVALLELGLLTVSDRLSDAPVSMTVMPAGKAIAGRCGAVGWPRRAGPGWTQQLGQALGQEYCGDHHRRGVTVEGFGVPGVLFVAGRSRPIICLSRRAAQAAVAAASVHRRHRSHCRGPRLSPNGVADRALGHGRAGRRCRRRGREPGGTPAGAGTVLDVVQAVTGGRGDGLGGDAELPVQPRSWRRRRSARR